MLQGVSAISKFHCVYRLPSVISNKTCSGIIAFEPDEEVTGLTLGLSHHPSQP